MRSARRLFTASVGRPDASVVPDEVGPPPWIRAVLGLALGAAAGALATAAVPRPTPVSSQPEPPAPL